nr:hypothetical protein [Tanacetum cinerariifolium]
MLRNHMDLLILSCNVLRATQLLLLLREPPLLSQLQRRLLLVNLTLSLPKKSKAPVKRKALAYLVAPSKEVHSKRKRKLKNKTSEAGSSAPAVEHDDDTEDIDQGNDLSETNFCTYLEGNLGKDEGYVDTSNVANASPSDHIDAQRARVKVIRRQMKPMDLLAQSVIARDRESSSPPKKALDYTVTHVEFERTESMYTSRMTSNSCLQDKVKFKRDQLVELRFEFSNLKEKHEKVGKLRDQLVEIEVVAARLTDELARTDSKLSEQALVMRDLENKLTFKESDSQRYWETASIARQHFNDLRNEVSYFMSFDFDGLVQRLLSSDEFNATLARILAFGITAGVKRGLRMGCSNLKFQKASQKISKADESTLLEMTSIRPKKLARLVVSASTPATSSLTGKSFGWTFTLKDSEPTRLAHDASFSST